MHLDLKLYLDEVSTLMLMLGVRAICKATFSTKTSYSDIPWINLLEASLNISIQNPSIF